MRSVFEEVMMDAMFELPSSKNVEKVIITAASVEGKEKPKLVVREIA